MLHFGIKLLKDEKECYLTRDNYASINDNKNSTIFFIDYVLHRNIYYSNFLLYPKKVMEEYLGKVKSYYETLKEMTSKQKGLLQETKNALVKLSKTKEEDYKKKIEKEIGKSQSASDYEKMLMSIYKRYDFDKSIEGRIYSKQYCEQLYKDAMINFDLNMEYFKHLDKDEFLKSIDDFLIKNPKFVQVKNLKEYEYKSGYYIMVLDNYKQVYIGTTEDIKKRILLHWHKKKHLDRLISPYGAINSSLLSIDSFRRLDTTRIYAFKTNKTYVLEDKFIDSFDKKFVINRLGGGYLELGAIQALLTLKEREFIKNRN